MIFTEENKSTITYDENWQNVSEPEYITASGEYDEREPETELSEKGRKKRSKPLLLTIQLILCLLAAAAAFVIKGLGGDIYKNAREMYYTELNRAVIFDKEHGFDLSPLFNNSTPDEA